MGRGHALDFTYVIYRFTVVQTKWASVHVSWIWFQIYRGQECFHAHFRKWRTSFQKSCGLFSYNLEDLSHAVMMLLERKDFLLSALPNKTQLFSLFPIYTLMNFNLQHFHWGLQNLEDVARRLFAVSLRMARCDLGVNLLGHSPLGSLAFTVLHLALWKLFTCLYMPRTL